jgi:hypothetical protein
MTPLVISRMCVNGNCMPVEDSSPSAERWAATGCSNMLAVVIFREI